MTNAPGPRSVEAAEALANQAKPAPTPDMARLEQSASFARRAEEGLQQIERGESVRLEDLDRELGDSGRNR